MRNHFHGPRKKNEFQAQAGDWLNYICSANQRLTRILKVRMFNNNRLSIGHRYYLNSFR